MKKTIKRTVIPITICEQSKEIHGVVNFSTESSNASIGDVKSQTIYKKSQVIYKSAIINKKEFEEIDENKVKGLEYYQSTIHCTNIKDRFFKIEVPLGVNFKSFKDNKTHQYFTLQFSNNQGTFRSMPLLGKLHLIAGSFDAKMESASHKAKKRTFEEMLAKQLEMLDNRIRKDVDIYDNVAEEEPEEN